MKKEEDEELPSYSDALNKEQDMSGVTSHQ